LKRGHGIDTLTRASRAYNTIGGGGAGAWNARRDCGVNVPSFRPHSRHFIELCRVGELARASELLDAQPEIVTDRNGTNETPLHTAARSNAPEAAQRLLAAGADRTAKNDRGATVVECVPEEADAELWQVLLRVA
jgi:hypothetical protein